MGTGQGTSAHLEDGGAAWLQGRTATITNPVRIVGAATEGRPTTGMASMRRADTAATVVRPGWAPRTTVAARARERGLPSGLLQEWFDLVQRRRRRS
eukprot:scaffold2136_cov242-Pinguiococcus_pyrenoidosus.AAC.10